MCVIIWAPNGEVPQKQVIRAMQAHPDGWGFSVASKGKLVTRRSINPRQFIKMWFNRPGGPVLLHARWASQGKVCLKNCHPFTVEEHAIVVAHNGTIPGYGCDKRSDTRHFIEEVIAPMPPWFTEEQGILNAIELAIGPSRMVLLHGSGAATILNEDRGFWVKGTWHSNRTALEGRKE